MLNPVVSNWIRLLGSKPSMESPSRKFNRTHNPADLGLVRNARCSRQVSPPSKSLTKQTALTSAYDTSTTLPAGVSSSRAPASKPPGDETNPASVSRSNRTTRTLLLVLAATYALFREEFLSNNFASIVSLGLNEGVRRRSSTEPSECAHRTGQVVSRLLPGRKRPGRQYA